MRKYIIRVMKYYMIPLWAFIIFSYPNTVSAQNHAPLTLQEGLKIVTEESRIVKIAQFNEAIAESDTHIARSAFLPSINASGGHTNLAYQPAMITFGLEAPMSGTSFYTYSITIQQLLFDFRASLSRYEASKMILETKKLDSARIKNAAALDFIKAFYDYMEVRHYITTSLAEINNLESHNRDAALLYENGVITRNDLLQVQVRLSDARQRYIAMKNTKALLASRLNEFLMRPLNNNVEAVERQETFTEPNRSEIEKSWEIALNNRPEILIADWTISALDLEMTSQKAEFLPKFFLRGANEYTENSYQRHENNWSLTFSANLSLFEGGRSYADLQKTKSRKRQLKEQRAKIADEIKLEVQSYSLNLKNAYERILVNKDATGQAEENLRINKRRYAEGEGTATEVLDAVTYLSAAETNYIKSVYDYCKAQAAFHYAVGENLLEVYR